MQNCIEAATYNDLADRQSIISSWRLVTGELELK